MKLCEKHSTFYFRLPLIFILTISILLLLFLISGCETIGLPFGGQTAVENQEVTSVETELIEEVPQTTEDIEEDSLDKDVTEEAEQQEEPVESSLTINVYYVDEQAEFLVGEERTITGTYKEDFIEAAFLELLKEPAQDNLYNMIPFGTELISLEYVDGYTFLNLTEEFVENKWEDGLTDILVVNCIAATMTEIPDVNGVVFKVDREKLEKYGSLDVSFPVRRNEELLK
jgi:spore germination protein GerM